MTTTTTRRKLTRDQLTAEATALFGPDPMQWAFRCPSCGDVATATDHKAAGGSPGMAGQECIGRSTKARGCSWVAYGLIAGPWEITVPAEDGKPAGSIWAFPLADSTTEENA